MDCYGRQCYIAHMEKPAIGRSQKVSPDAPQPEGLCFRIPYGEAAYDISLANFEVERIFVKALQKIIGKKSTIGFEFDVELEPPDLPLFIGAAAIEVTPKTQKHEVAMHVGVVTHSHVYEHRGILQIHRDIDGEWSVLNYASKPPLTEIGDHTWLA